MVRAASSRILRVSILAAALVAVMVSATAALAAPATTTTTIQSSKSPSIVGEAITLTANVQSSNGTCPTGYVGFSDAGSLVGVGVLASCPVSTPDTASANLVLSLLTLGTHNNITASYVNDKNSKTLPSSTSAALSPSQVVNLRPTSVSVTSLDASEKVNIANHLTVQVTDAAAGIPSGTPGAFDQATPKAINKVRTGHAMARLLDGTFLVYGGTDGSNFYSGADIGVIYDAANGTQALSDVSALAQVPRTGHTATRLLDSNGSVIVIGGITDGAVDGATCHAPGSGNNVCTDLVVFNPVISDSATTTAFSPAAGTFTQLGVFLATARTSHTATVLASGKIFIAGGFDGAGHTLTSWQIYDPALGVLYPENTLDQAGTQAGDALQVARSNHSATLLADGKTILFIGGDSGSANATAELFDTTTGHTVGSTISLGAFALSGQIAALMPDGNVIVAGGTTTNAVSTARLYDAMTNTFVSAGAMTTARTAFAASRTNDGHVIVVGGINSAAVATAELYTPAFDPQSTITAAGVGGTVTKPDTAVQCSTVATGDMFTLSGTGMSSCNSAKLTPIAVDGGTHTITLTYTADSVHDTSTDSTTTYTVTKGDAVITPKTPSIKYCDTAFNSFAPTSDIPGTFSFTFNGNPADINTNLHVSDSPATINYTFTPTDTADFNSITTPTAGNVITIGPSDLNATISAHNQVYNGQSITQASTGAAMQLAGACHNDSVNVASQSFSFGGDAHVDTGAKSIGATSIALSNVSGDYTVNGSASGSGSANTTVNITAKDLTATAKITPGSANRIYNGTTSASPAADPLGTNSTNDNDGKVMAVDTAQLNLSGGQFNSAHAAQANSVTANATVHCTAGVCLNHDADYSVSAQLTDTTAVMTAKHLNASLKPTNRIYNGTNDASSVAAANPFDTGGTADGDGKVITSVGDAATPTVANAKFNSIHVSSANQVTANPGVHCTSHCLDTDYAVDAQVTDNSASMTPKSITTASIKAAARIYNGGITATASGNVGKGGTQDNDGKLAQPDDATVGVQNAKFNSAHVVQANSVTADTSLNCTLNCQNTDYNFPAQLTDNTAVMTPKSVTASLVQGTTRIYNGSLAANPVANALPTGGTQDNDGMLVVGDAASPSLSNQKFNSAHVLQANTVTADVTVVCTANCVNGDYVSNPATDSAATISPKTVTASLNQGSTKIYDGTDNGNAVPKALLTGGTQDNDGMLVVGDAAAVSVTAQHYNSAHVALANSITATASVACSSGCVNGDYGISGPLTDASAIITPKSLTGGVVAGTAKIYDGTTAASPTPAALPGGGVTANDGKVIGSDVVHLNLSNAVYNSKHVVGATSVTANASLDNTDYSVSPTLTDAGAKITPKMLAASLVSGTTKIFDNTAAAVPSANPLLTGGAAGVNNDGKVITGDTTKLTISAPAYDSVHAGTRTVSANASVDNSDYQVPAILQDKQATITPAPTTSATLGTSLSTSTSGLTITVNATVLPTTNVNGAIPTGSFTLSDSAAPGATTTTAGLNGAAQGTAILANLQPPASGTAQHTVQVVYPGQGDFAGKTVGVTTITLSSAVTNIAGQSIATLTIPFTNPETPGGATTGFTVACAVVSINGANVPVTVAPHCASSLNGNNIVVDLATVKGAAASSPSPQARMRQAYEFTFAIPGIVLAFASPAVMRRKRVRGMIAWLGLFAVVAMLLTFAACGGNGFVNPNNIPPVAAAGSTPAGQYVIIVTATSPNAPHNQFVVASIPLNVS